MQLVHVARRTAAQVVAVAVGLGAVPIQHRAQVDACHAPVIIAVPNRIAHSYVHKVVPT